MAIAPRREPGEELPQHSAFYDTRGSRAGAVVHLRCHHAVALSTLPDIDTDSVLPPHPVMQLGAVKLLPYMPPGASVMRSKRWRIVEDATACWVIVSHHSNGRQKDKIMRGKVAING